jgi:acyl-CoA synthetase (AMP-forming)/AMP-acid ligase II
MSDIWMKRVSLHHRPQKDLIIRGGENVYPKEVENVLYQHPQVLEAGVIGIPDPVYGESVKAFISLKTPRGATAEELMAFLQGTLPSYKRPTAIQLVEALPKSAVGKDLAAGAAQDGLSDGAYAGANLIAAGVPRRRRS